MQLKKKYVISFVILSVCLLISLVWLLFPFFIETYLSAYVRHHYNADLSVEGISHEKGTWVLKNPYITREDSQTLFKADVITVTPKFSFRERTLLLSCDVQNPHVDVALLTIPSISIHGAKKEGSFSWIKLKSQFSADKGKLLLNEEEAVFCINKNEAYLWCDSKDQSRNFLILQYEEGNLLNVNFHQFECHHLNNFIKVGFLSDWEIESGTLNGSMNFSKLSSHLLLKQLVLCNNKTGSFAKIPHALLQLSESGWGNFEFLESANLNLGSQSIENIHISANFKPNFEIDYQITGNGVFENHVKGISNIGTIFFDKTANLNLKNTLLLSDSQGEVEKVNLHFSHIHDSWYDCRGSFENINLQDIPLDMNRGQASGSFYALINNFYLQSVTLDHFFVKDLEGNYQQLEVGIKELEGSCFIDVLQQEISAVDLKIHDCNISNYTDHLNAHIASEHENEFSLNVDGVSDHFGNYTLKGMLLGSHFNGLLELEDVQLELSLTLDTQPNLLKEGYFLAKNLPLEKYIAPFIFNPQKLRLQGCADVEGLFDLNSIVLGYDPSQLSLENDYFLVKFHEGLFATHYFDFNNGFHGGLIPLINGSYLEKTTGIQFNDIHTCLTLGSHSLFGMDLEGYCHDLFVKGDLYVDYRDEKGTIDVSFSSDQIVGSTIDVKKIVSHFKKEHPFSSLPIEGDICSGSNEGVFLAHITPKGVQFDANVKGSLTEGRVASQNENISLQEISLNFEYDHKDDKLNLRDLQGTVLIGFLDDFEEYFLNSEPMFIDLVNWNSEFDFWIGNRNRDIFRLKGKSESDHSNIAFSFDKQVTHFGDVHPNELSFSLSPNLEMRDFYFNSSFRLETLLDDLKLLMKANFFNLPLNIVKEIDKLKQASGAFDLNILESDEKGLLNFQLIGSEIAIGNQCYKKCGIKGKKKDHVYYLDELFVDDLSIATEIRLDEKIWHVPFLGLRLGDSLLGGCSGKYDLDKNELYLDVNLLSLNLKNLSLAHYLESMDLLNLSGSLQGTGAVEMKFGSSLDSVKTKARLHLTAKEISANQFYFKELNPFILVFDTQEGVVIDYEPYKINLQFDPKHLSRALVLISDKEQNEIKILTELKKTGLHLRQIEGSCYGVRANLQENTKTQSLEGFLNVSLPEAYFIFPKEMQNFFEKYPLKGAFKLAGNFCYFNHLDFEGTLKADSFQFNDIELDQLTANIKCSESNLKVEHLTIKDEAFSLFVPELLVTSDVLVSIPKLQILDFYPGKLKYIQGKNAFNESTFRMRTLELKEFTAPNFDIFHFKGEGQLSYENPWNPTTHFLLQIPKEILSQFHLDLKPLSPVEGTLFFDIRDGKVYITKIKGMYSENRLSKFYLAKEDDSSYLDFDGNLKLHLKMKHNNLLYKVAELFTLSIQGPLESPKVSIFKH